MAMTALPTLDRTAATFRSDVDDFFSTDLPNFVTEANALEANVVAKEVIAVSSAATASAAATSAGASAAAAASAGNAAAWVSGTTYSTGECVYSPVTFYTYRRKTDGGGTTDPSLDTTNWEWLAGTQTATLHAIALYF